MTTPPFPSFTSTWHNDTYPAIDPKSPGLSHTGKRIVITGAGTGIGRATALAYAQSATSSLFLLGRTEATLLETARLVRSVAANTEIEVKVCVVSVADEAGMKRVAEGVGKWDVLVLNAAYLSPPGKVGDMSVEEFWRAYETNVKSIVIATHVFLPSAHPNAAVLTVGAGGCHFPPAFAGLAGYMSSKVAQAKLVEYLAAENPDVLFCSVHPGVVDTEMLHKAELVGMPTDTVELPAHFMVWLSHDVAKTRFLSGRFVWVNWDVEELLQRKEEIGKSDVFTMGLMGWPFEKKA